MYYLPVGGGVNRTLWWSTGGGIEKGILLRNTSRIFGEDLRPRRKAKVVPQTSGTLAGNSSDFRLELVPDWCALPKVGGGQIRCRRGNDLEIYGRCLAVLEKCNKLPDYGCIWWCFARDPRAGAQ